MNYLWQQRAFAISFIFLVSCATLGLVAQNFDERLARTLASHTAVQKGTGVSLNAKQISSADAKHVLKLADDVKPFIDGAYMARSIGDQKDADAKLQLAVASLTALQTYLNERGKK